MTRSAGRDSAWSARAPSYMRSLTLKLTLAFLIVGLIGALLVACFVGLLTQRAFNQFITDRGRPTLVMDLTRYYQTTGGWSGVSSVFERGSEYQVDRQGNHQPPVLADANGLVVSGSERYAVGTRVPPGERSRGIPVIVDNTVVGWLLNDFGGARPGPGTPESNFLLQITRAITYSAIGATALALLLGILLARTLTHPLRELTSATQSLARGALGQQVKVRSGDELGTLAASFNQMSADLAHASTLRRQMTADIAHDLRTPLSVILGYTEALREGKLPFEQEIFDTLHTEAQHLQHLVDDLRTLSLADAGELPLTRQPIAAQLLLERVAAAHKAYAQAHTIAVEVQAAPDLPEVDVDPERMAQVLGNLLSNALRYTPPGGTITLAADARADLVRLRVRDTGTGIAPDDLPHIFERFYRADSSRQQADGSSGLGLAIVKSIVEAHGGTIAVVCDEGTTFTISLPAHDPRRPATITDRKRR